MKTEEILKLIGERQLKDNLWEWEEYDFLEEVGDETTNPRRDYVGYKTYIKNKTDGKFFYIEIYGNDIAYQIYSYGEVKPVEKTTITYEEIKNEN